jgi:hypothetical protein
MLLPEHQQERKPDGIRPGPNHWLNFAGLSVLLAGLGLDGLLHRLDPALVEQESIFSLGNPGHLLMALGIGLLVANTVLFLVRRAWNLKKRAGWRGGLLVMAACWLLGLCAVNGVLALQSDGLLHGQPTNDTEFSLNDALGLSNAANYTYYYAEDEELAEQYPATAEQVAQHPAGTSHQELPSIFQPATKTFYQPSKHTAAHRQPTPAATGGK